MRSRSSSKQPSGNVKISSADVAHARQDGPDALRFYREVGLSEARRRALRLTLSGAVPLLGMLLWHWSALSLMVYLLADALITVVADCLRFGLAADQLKTSHQRESRASFVLLVVDGLDDGSNMRPSIGRDSSPALVLFFGVVSSLLLVPILVAGVTEKIGLAPLQSVLADPAFPWLLAANAVMQFSDALFGAYAARSGSTRPFFVESGGTVVLYLGVMVLVWLPLKFGNLGLIWMFGILYSVRIAFGLFALWYLPRSVTRLARRLETGDFSLRKSEKSAG